MTKYPRFNDVFKNVGEFRSAYELCPRSSYIDEIDASALAHIYYHLSLQYGGEHYKWDDVRKCIFNTIDTLNHCYYLYTRQEKYVVAASKLTDEEIIKSGASIFSELTNPDVDNLQPDNTTMPFINRKTVQTGKSNMLDKIGSLRGQFMWGLTDKFYEYLSRQLFTTFYIDDYDVSYIGGEDD